MPQTLLAALALTMAALLGFTQHRAAIQSYEVRIRDEYSVAASGLLTEIMELIAARSFDEATTPEWIYQIQRMPTRTDFTFPEHFGRYSPLPGQGRGLQRGIQKQRDNVLECDLLKPLNTPLCSDVDDVDQIVDQAVSLVIDDGRAMRFLISAEVHYVEDFDTGTITQSRTHNKRVRLRATSPDLSNRGLIAEMIRVIAYDPVKAEAEYELIYGPFLGS